MIGALVAFLSLQLTNNLVTDGIVSGTLPITNATPTSPIAVTVANHGVPLGRIVDGVVSGVGGIAGANGVWRCTPIDANTFSLSTYTPAGLLQLSSGTGVYTSGGQIQYAFPDYCILLGRRYVQLASAVATPRIVMVPTSGRGWGYEPYGGLGAAQGPIPHPPPGQRGVRGTVEQQNQTLNPQLETEFTTFEVYVTGAAPDFAPGNPLLSPDFGDFDATQKLVFAFYEVLFDTITQARAKILKEAWPSQMINSGTMTQRGQQWVGLLEVQQPVIRLQALQYVPLGTNIQFTVTPVNGGSGDATIFTVT